MDRRLLYYYNRELQHLREMGGEFAKEFPKVAGRLGLTEFACADPYVERLLEGFAFLAARVQLKLEAEFPRFTQSLLETVYPHYLAPTPSMVIAQFLPDLTSFALAEGFPIPHDTILRSIPWGEQTGDRTQRREYREQHTGGTPSPQGREYREQHTGGTPCEYRTAHDVKLYPIRVLEAQYHTRDLAALLVPQQYGAKAAIRIRLQCPPGRKFSGLKIDNLTFHLRGTGETATHVYEQLFSNSAAVVVRPTIKPIRWSEVLGPSNVRQVGFQDEQALLPYGSRSFQGYRLVREYFAFPQRYMFVELTGLGGAVPVCHSH